MGAPHSLPWSNTGGMDHGISLLWTQEYHTWCGKVTRICPPLGLCGCLEFFPHFSLRLTCGHWGLTVDFQFQITLLLVPFSTVCLPCGKVGSGMVEAVLRTRFPGFYACLDTDLPCAFSCITFPLCASIFLFIKWEKKRWAKAELIPLDCNRKVI